MVGCRIAQQDGFTLTAKQRFRNRLGGIRGLACGGSRYTPLESNRCSHIGQRLSPGIRSRQKRIGKRYGPCICSGQLCYRINSAQCASSADRLANTLCKQRMVFAQIRTHYQHALQLGQGHDGSA